MANKPKGWAWGIVSLVLAFGLGLLVALLPRGSRRALREQMAAERAAGKLAGVREVLADQLDRHEAETARRGAERAEIARMEDEMEALRAANDAIGRRPK